METAEPTFTAKRVCTALDAPHGTLNSWAHHFPGFFRNLDAATTRPGKAREYSLKDLIRLAIFKQLIDFRMTGERATTWADLCIEYMDRYGPHITEMHVFLYSADDHEEIRFNQDVMNSPVTPGWVLRLSISLIPIIDELKARLESSQEVALAAEDKTEAEPDGTRRVEKVRKAIERLADDGPAATRRRRIAAVERYAEDLTIPHKLRVEAEAAARAAWAKLESLIPAAAGEGEN
jgi:hypothetical protein